MATKKKKPEPIIQLADGREDVRRFRTDIWYDGRLREPARWTRGFPKEEIGSIQTAGRLVMTGLAFKVGSFDRVRGRYAWTVKRGRRVPRTHVYEPIVVYGEAE